MWLKPEKKLLSPAEEKKIAQIKQTFPILDIELPQGIPHGTYTCYGIVATAGSDPWDGKNWIHYDFKTFEMK